MKNVAFVVVALGMVACNSRPNVVDSGAIVLPDGGAGDGGGGAVDMGSSGCAPEMAPAPTAASCAMATLTCLMGAADAAAQQACLAADPMPDACLGCLNQDILFTCTNMGSCADELGNVECCLQTACPTGADACVNPALDTGGACATQADALGTCTDSEQTAHHCGITMTCFGS